MRPLLALLSLLLVYTDQAQAETLRWRMATSWSGGPLYDACVKSFSEQMKERSGESFIIDTFQAGVIGNALQITDTVKNGVVQAGHSVSVYDWGKDKTAVLFGGFAGSMPVDTMERWLYEGGGTERWAEWRRKKFSVIGIPLCMRGPEVFLYSHRPIRTLDDLRGLKIRSTGAWLEIARGLGAAPLTSSGADVYPMLERRTVDAIEWGTAWENEALGFHRVAKYISMPGVHQPTAVFELLINPRAWDSLSEQQRSLIQEVARSVTIAYKERNKAEEPGALERMRAAGNEITELDESVRVKAQELANAWADAIAKENLEFGSVLSEQRAFAAAHPVEQ